MMISELPEYEQQRRVNAMVADPHVRGILHEIDDLTEEYPEVVIYYQVSCDNCGSRLTDPDKFSLRYSYICDLCAHETKTSDGYLGYISMFLPPGMPDPMQL